VRSASREVPLEVSLEELIAYAEAHAGSLAVVQQRRRYGAAERAGAEPLLGENPILELGIGPRLGGDSQTDFDFVASLGQPVELAGERGARLDVASRLDERLDAELLAARGALRREVTLAYHAASVAREVARLAEQVVAFSEEVTRVARRRLDAGDGTVIELRVAEAELAQARGAQLDAARALRVARLELAELTGWSIESPPQVSAALPSPRPVPPLAFFARAASEHHPELRARRASVLEARARVELADREAWPTPTFGVQVAREGSAGSPANYIVLGTVGFALPLWQQHQGERARRRVDLDVARAEEEAAARAILARLARAHAELEVAVERVGLARAGVLPALEESLTLLQRGFDAGELPLFEVSFARERFLAAQRDAIAAHGEYCRALAELEYAVGAALPRADGTGGAAASEAGADRPAASGGPAEDPGEGVALERGEELDPDRARQVPAAGGAR
jgi:cobalt-zinc-cadmium efflux system outer membrane protein